MEAHNREIRYYQTKTGKVPYWDYLKGLKEVKIRAAIDLRVARAATGNFGDHSSVGNGLFELRLHLGPGFRVYYGLDGDTFVVVATAGEKKTQPKDIKSAKVFWEDYLKRKS